MESMKYEHTRMRYRILCVSDSSKVVRTTHGQTLHLWKDVHRELDYAPHTHLPKPWNISSFPFSGISIPAFPLAGIAALHNLSVSVVSFQTFRSLGLPKKA